ncbi:MAG: VirB6/TrbL-like conjugal transfer protein, CD1112 family [Ruminococcus sp.]
MKQGLAGILLNIFIFMDSGLSTVSDDGYISTFLTSHPSEFTGNVNGGTAIWTTIEGICNTAVVPIGGMVLTIVLVTELIQMCIAGNNFRDFDTAIFMKWIIKAACGMILISNVFYITSAVFTIGSEVATTALNALSNQSMHLDTDTYMAYVQAITAKDMDFGTIFSLILIAIVLYLAVYIMVAVIVVVMCSRTIEIFMMLGVSPVPMATFMGTEWKQMGHNWLRNVLALAFQALFIIIAIAIFKTLFVNVLQSMIADQSGIILQMAILLGYTLAMIFTMLRSGSISKSVFCAH